MTWVSFFFDDTSKLKGGSTLEFGNSWVAPSAAPNRHWRRWTPVGTLPYNPKHMNRTTVRPSACCCCTCCLLKSLPWHFSLVVCSGRSTPWKKSWYYSVLYLFLVCLMFKPRSRHTKWYDFFMTCIVHFKLAVFSKSMLVCSSSSSALFRKKRFMLDENFY